MHSQVLHCAFGAIVAMGIFSYALTRRENVSGRNLVAGFSAALFVWCVGMGLRRLLPPAMAEQVAFPIYFAAGMSLPPLWFLVAASQTRADFLRGFSPRALGLALGTPPLLLLIAAFTDDFHQLYFRAGSNDIDRPITEIGGPLLWVSALWSWLLISAGIFFYLRKAARLIAEAERVRGLLLAGAALAPLPVAVANSLGAFGTNSGWIQSTCACSVALLFTLNWRYQLRETLPLARRDIIEHLFDGVVVIGPTGEILDANPAATRLFEASADSLRGGQIEQAFGGLLRDGERIQFERASSDVASSHGPWFHSFRDRRSRLLEVTTAELPRDAGESAGYFVVLRDQTERKRLETLLRQSQRLETISGLAAGIAHEVNNPLAYVRANLNHVLRLEEELEASLGGSDAEKCSALVEIREVTNESLDGIDRIAGIVERMRQFSRIQDGTVEGVDLNGVVADAVKLSHLHRSDSIDIQVQLDPELPEIQGSAEHLVQALLNLILYAKQAVAPQRDARIRIETRALDGLVEVIVEDNGSEGAHSIPSRRYDPFFTNETPKEDWHVGLAIAFGIIREHYGVLEIEGEAGAIRHRLRIPFSVV